MTNKTINALPPFILLKSVPLSSKDFEGQCNKGCHKTVIAESFFAITRKMTVIY